MVDDMQEQGHIFREKYHKIHKQISYTVVVRKKGVIEFHFVNMRVNSYVT